MKQDRSSSRQDTHVHDTQALRAITAFFRDEDGNATVPFVLLVAVTLSIFFATVSPINTRLKTNLYSTASWIVFFSTTAQLTEPDEGEAIEKSISE